MVESVESDNHYQSAHDRTNKSMATLMDNYLKSIGYSRIADTHINSIYVEDLYALSNGLKTKR